MSNNKVLPSLIIVIILMVVACKDKSTGLTELDKMHNEVMSVHDEVMPKISEINRLSRQLKSELEKTTNPGSVDTIQTIIEALEKADEGMMNWMYEFKKPDLKDFEIAKQYYEGEMVKIKKVKEDINQSIERAQKILNQ